jgi:predicted ATPase
MAAQWQAALERLAEARRLADETEDRWFQAETLRLSGDVLSAMGDPAAAEARYREAILIAQGQSAKLWELRAAMSLARLWRDQGKCAEARELLAPVYGRFTEGFGTRCCKERPRPRAICRSSSRSRRPLPSGRAGDQHQPPAEQRHRL